MNTEAIRVDPKAADRDVLKKAADVLNNGGLVAFPTETVYGLGADYLNSNALHRLYIVKQRPQGKPFTLHISSLDELDRFSCEVLVFSRHLIEKFWPGPLTLIFNTKSGEKIGIRMPRNKVALEFISLCKNPIVAPSANISGKKPPCNAQEVLKELDGQIDLVLDGGETELGMESTVVDVSIFPYRILREGAISKTQIADVGRELQGEESQS